MSQNPDYRRRRVPIPNSEHPPLAGAHWLRDVPEDSSTRIVVVVRRRLNVHRSPFAPSPDKGGNKAHWMTLYHVRRWLGAEDADLAMVTDFAAELGLHQHAVYPAFRYVVLDGTVAAINAAFGVKLG
jgi:hypothetical protein